MAKTADEFVRTYNGKAIDDDKAFGVQCVDAFRVFTKWAINKVWTTGGTGRANGYWYNRGRYKDYFDAVDTKHLRNGDWVIWDVNSKSHPASHIAMYYNGQEFSQNQSGDRAFCLKDTDFSDALGALRWKGLETAPQPAKPATNTSGYRVGDTVVPTVLKDVHGVSLKQWDKQYTVTAVNGNAVTLSARGQVWATLPAGNIRKVGASAPAKPATPAPAPIKVGDRVKVLNPINYDTGRKFGLYYSVYTVMELRGKRAVIGVNGVVTAAINTSNIRKA